MKAKEPEQTPGPSRLILRVLSSASPAFPRPTSGRVCVKVINHFGDEVQKVFDV